ncbi:MAG: Gfo/Idh/MocA family oxidoreductase [Burkholderiales bacterium]|nr:Gfo/Idh/MocA family oxidoreductase [Anaerolineae bacterium]
MYEKIRWGILGTGSIAHKFATGLTALDDVEIAAVGSRSQAGADKFGDEFNIPRRHASYEALASDAEVDAIYISTPHPFHKDNTLLALKAGKAVITEKPFAMNIGEAREMVDYARENGRFLMEAMWTRYLPIIVRVRELLAEGAIGEPRMLLADFGFRMGSVEPKHRLFDPDLGGGALLDVGIYPLSLSSMIFGSPDRITAMADIGSTGVDEQAAIILGHPSGQLASLTTAIRTNTPHEAVILGTNGQIKLHASFWKGTRATVSISGKDALEIDLPLHGNGYNYEAAEVARCLREGKTESDIMPLDETLSIMQTMDTIRAQWGLKYPME